jgi:hypothetical protein
MIKELFDGFIYEITNEKNHEKLAPVIYPVYNKLKFSYFVVIFLLIIITANLLFISVKINNFSINNVP